MIFVTKSSAPASSEATLSVSVFRTVSIIIAIAVRDLISRHVASLPMPGIFISRKNKIGTEVRNLAERLVASLGVIHFVAGES
jgi:hypothetical protein